jgi:tetratricopeptide (TPR) repeat protein
MYGQDTRQVQLANEYYGQGEFDKARALYEKLSTDMNNIPLIHNNYYYLLLDTQDFSAAENYIDRLLKRNPDNIYYYLDRAYLEVKRNNPQEAQKRFGEIIDQAKTKPHLVRIVSSYLLNKQLTDEAIRIFLEARKALGNPFEFSLEMANIYRLMNEQDKMVREYLNYVIQNPSNLKYVQNTLQNLLTEPEELESFERLLYDKIQDEPNNNVYSELLIWTHLQQKNFYGAFIQSRALDKRAQTQGSRTLNIGMIALDNDDYTSAIKIFSYLISEYPESYNYVLARMYLIRSYEKRVRNTYPVNEEEIRNLITDYNIFIKDLAENRNAFEAMRSKAMLHAFYLDEKDSAVTILQEIISEPRAGEELIAKSKLDLGDIYLLSGKPWESTLLFSQVEKSNKEERIGYEAKLKNAKLHYFKGDFKLAQEHLDILKQATTREIANDAMELSVLIKDNTVFDSTELAMQDYAKTELLLYQNKTAEALQLLDSMKTAYSDHPIVDEILWLEATIERRQGNFEEALALLRDIEENYDQDILGDDAYFLIGEIYERDLKDYENAMTVYREFLTRYPGSVFVAEARKRFRQLRGDVELSENSTKM